MKKTSSLLYLFCISLCLSTFTACDPNPGEIRKTSKADIKPPSVNEGTEASFQ